MSSYRDGQKIMLHLVKDDEIPVISVINIINYVISPNNITNSKMTTSKSRSTANPLWGAMHSQLCINHAVDYRTSLFYYHNKQLVFPVL